MHQVLNEKIPYFSDDGLSCAESSLRWLIENGYADLPLDTVRIMTGLHGNMGHCANCGAVNGGTGGRIGGLITKRKREMRREAAGNNDCKNGENLL